MNESSSRHNTRHRKARQDRNRDSLFNRLFDAIVTAAREQRQHAPNQPCPPDAGGVPSPRLSRALADARKHSVPKSRIDGALSLAARGAGPKSDATCFDALAAAATSTFEGEYPGGVGVLVRLATEATSNDRVGTSLHGAAQAVRGLFQKTGGRAGSCCWLFDEIWTVECRYPSGASPIDLEEIVTVGIESGATDVDEIGLSDSGASNGSEADGASEPAIVFSVAGRKEAASVKAALVGSSEIRASGASVWVDREVRPKSVVPVSAEEWEELCALIRRLRQREDFVEVIHNASPPAGSDVRRELECETGR